MSNPHYLMEVTTAACAIAIAIVMLVAARKLPQPWRAAGITSLGILIFFIGFAGLLSTIRIAKLFPVTVVALVRCFGVFSLAIVGYVALLACAVRLAPAYSPRRRRVLQIAGGAAVAAPVGLSALAILKRDNLVVREVDVYLPSLSRDLYGIRIVQLTDLHLSTFVSERTIRSAVGLANDLKGHIAVVTGDLITLKGDPLDACLRHLSQLRAEAGVFGCCGNHEIYAEAEEYVEKTSAIHGIDFLRQRARPLRFGNSTLNLAGVDYQRRERPYLAGAEALLRRDSFNVLLSHNPDVFPVAAGKGFDLTIAGHTHGGQVNFELIHPSLNIARFITPFVYGLYENGARRLWVSSGVGTIGVPARLNAPPEVVCIRLCATSS